MKQKISLFYVAIAFSIAGLCTSCSSDDPVDDTGGGTNNPGGTSSDVKQLDYGELLAFPYAEGHGRNTTGGRGLLKYLLFVPYGRDDTQYEQSQYEIARQNFKM